MTDGTWFTTPDQPNALGQGLDFRVLLAQITTLGTPTYDLNIQVIDGGVGGTAEKFVWDPASVSEPNEIDGSGMGLSFPAASTPGCMTVTACNYNAAATTDDGSCISATGCDTCSGETDGTGTVVDNPEVGEACDDGDAGTMTDTIQGDCSCAGIVIVNGCTNAAACNYNIAANVDDASCILATGCDTCSGETDGTGTVVDNPEVGEACDDGDAGTMTDTIQGDCSCAGIVIVNGCTNAAACNYNVAANVDDASCILATGCDTCSGETDGTGTVVDNLEVGDACDDGNAGTINDTIQADCSCAGDGVITGCMDMTACNYNSNANTADTCVFATGCDTCSGETDGTGTVVDNLEVGDACDDGDAGTMTDTIQGDCSCAGIVIVNGCTNAAACNYNIAANVDDASCVLATGCDTCSGETDGTGTVVDNPETGDVCDDGDAGTTNDMIQGDCSCGGDLLGCTDVSAMNYDAAAVVDDGSCLFAMTFNVDMNCEAPGSFTTPAIESPVFGWCGGCAPMTDADLDGVWTLVLNLPAGNFEYKYAVDNFAGQEDLIDDMIAGGTCAPITDFATFANRQVAVVAGSTFNDTYGSCSACVVGGGCTDMAANNFDAAAIFDDGSCTYDVVFNVDMNCEAPGSFTTPAIEGPLFGWCGGCVPMTDADLDGIWTATVSLAAGNFEYKYSVDNFAGQEDLIDDMVAGGTCAPITDFATFANREINIGVILTTNDTYGSCSACVQGCDDATACNYNAAATSDDGSCIYAAGCDTCSGETDGTGTVIDNQEVGEACDDGNAATLFDTIQADCSCAGTDPTLPQSQLDYDAGDYDLCQLIKADWVGADDYRFVFTPSPSGAVINVEQGGANTFLQLKNVAGLTVGVTYGVTVDAEFAGVWSIGTISKDVSVTAPTVIVNPVNNCANHGPHYLGDYINAKPYVCGGDKWEWTFTEVGQLPIVHTRNSSNRYLRLSSVAGLSPGVSYDVTVRAGYPNGAFTASSTVECIQIVGAAPGVIAAGGPVVDQDEAVTRDLEVVSAAIYPNPNNGNVLNINLNGVEDSVVLVDIVNMMGATVERVQLNAANGNVNEMIAIDLASGVYLVNIQVNGEVLTERLIVQK